MFRSFLSNFKSRIFVQFVQLNEYLGTASKLLQRARFQFLLFKHNVQNRTRLKGVPLSVFFRNCETFFRKHFLPSKGPPSLLLKSPLVIFGVKRYIRTFDVISEQCFVLVRFSKEAEVQKHECFKKTSYACFKNCAF